jgi:hypothetical protein
MNLMRARILFVPAILMILLAEVFLPGWAKADDCITRPNAAPPQGSHWYYRVDRTTHRECWYLGAEGVKVRARSPQADAEVRPPRAPKQVSRPIPQPAAEAEGAEAIAFETQAAKDNLNVATASVEPLALGIPDQRPGDAAPVTSSRAEEYAATETIKAAPPISIPDDPTRADRLPESTIAFVHLMGVLAVVLGLVAIIGRTIFRLSMVGRSGRGRVRPGSDLGSIPPSRKRVPSKSSKVTAAARNTDRPGATAQSIIPQLNDIDKIEASVRRLLRELQRREHQPRDFQTKSRQSSCMVS